MLLEVKKEAWGHIVCHSPEKKIKPVDSWISDFWPPEP